MSSPPPPPPPSAVEQEDISYAQKEEAKVDLGDRAESNISPPKTSEGDQEHAGQELKEIRSSQSDENPVPERAASPAEETVVFPRFLPKGRVNPPSGSGKKK